MRCMFEKRRTLIVISLSGQNKIRSNKHKKTLTVSVIFVKRTSIQLFLNCF